MEEWRGTRPGGGHGILPLGDLLEEWFGPGPDIFGQGRTLDAIPLAGSDRAVQLSQGIELRPKNADPVIEGAELGSQLGCGVGRFRLARWASDGCQELLIQAGKLVGKELSNGSSGELLSSVELVLHGPIPGDRLGG